MSGFQQYWSLSVEEQFYLLWPVMMLGVVVAASRARRAIRTLAGVVLGILVAVSFALSVGYSASEPIASFFLKG